MAALLPTSSLSSALRQQSTSLPLRFNSSPVVRSGKVFSTSSSALRLGQRARHAHTRQSPLSSSALSSSHLSLKSSSHTSQTCRTITVQARPPQSSSGPISTPTSKLASKQQQSSSPSSVPAESSETLPLTNLPYFIRRTPSNQLPVYIVTKSGGTRQQTKIQKTEGDLEALRTDLARALGLESSGSAKSPDVFINRTNGHVVVKGWRKPDIVKFLSDRKF